MIKKLFSGIYLIFVCIIPVGVIIATGLYVTGMFLRSPLAFEHGKIFFGLDIATATLAGLSFYASYTSSDQLRKRSYYSSAENFFQSMVLFIFVTFMQEIIIRLHAFIIREFFKDFLLIIISSSVIFCFIFAFKHFTKGIINLMKTFHQLSNECN